MSLRAARPEDAGGIEDFLAGHAESSMFLRSNLRRTGVTGGDTPHATKMWLEERDGITGVYGISTAGFVIMQLPGGVDAAAVQRVSQGREISGVIGVPDQVQAVVAALGIDTGRAPEAGVEPLFRLDLADLVIPAGDSALRMPEEGDRAVLEDWRFAYRQEIDGFAAPRAQAARDVDGLLAGGDLRLLCAPDGSVLAMTAFNARLPDMVQIGNVYTPPALRGQGHARRAVALHLADAHSAGVKTALLFSASAAASRAYEAIGFRRIGAYQLLLLKAPQVVES